MDVRRPQFAVSQIGVRASRHLPDARHMLITLEDLPPGWKVLDERRWRTGLGQEPRAVRVRARGGFTAWRSFVASANDRWLWVQASPLATDEDTAAALGAIWTFLMKNAAAEARVVATREGPDMILPGGNVKTLEQQTTGPRGPGAARYVGWTYGHIVGALAGSAFGEPWSWQSLQEVAAKQNRRIDAVICR